MRRNKERKLPGRPNIIVFMTDQQVADTILKENPTITPNADRFRNRAVQFENAYCPSPHCCPSRATFFTGLYPSEHGVWHNVEVCNAISRGLFEKVKMFPEELRENGYRNYFSGKWHVSAFEGPADRGFDVVLREFVSNYGRMEKGYVPHYEDWEHFYSNAYGIDGWNEKKEFGRIIRPGYPTYYQFGIDENPFGDRDSVELAIEAIKNHNHEEPFFLYAGVTGPHDPYTPPQEFLDLYDIEDIKLPENFLDKLEKVPALYRRTKEQFKLTEAEHRESLRRYMAFCTFEDYLFGKILDVVEEEGIEEETIILYLSDHGDYAGAHGLWAKGLPCFREAYHICAMIGGGGIVSDFNKENLVSLADFAPTILELAGIKPSINFSGQSLVPFLYGKGKNVPWREEICTQSNGNEIYGIQRAVWNKEWKYVYNSFDYDELYHISEDPREMNNVIHLPENQEMVKTMCARMWKFAREHKDGCTCPYIMVGLAPYGPGITLDYPL